jgi:1-acyl-sn-glycerol-3-phosphate acyltransferase
MGNQVEASAVSSAPRIGPVRLAWGALGTILSVLYTAVLAPLAAITGPFFNGHAVTYLGRLWGWLIVRTCGVTVEIRGLENLEGLKSYVLAVNHQSFFDIFAIAAYMPGEPRFVAKKELLKIPVFGYALRTSGHIVIDRDKGGQAIRHALKSARNGYSIVVFAEGHRFSDNRVHEFQDGAAWLAIATHLPSVPMAISGTAALMPRGAKFPVPGRRMRMTLGKPIATAGLKSADRIELTRKLEAAVRDMFVSEV